MGFYLNREAWRPLHWVVLVAFVAEAKVTDIASNHGWWFLATLIPLLILWKCLPRDFVGLSRAAATREQDNAASNSASPNEIPHAHDRGH